MAVYYQRPNKLESILKVLSTMVKGIHGIKEGEKQKTVEDFFNLMKFEEIRGRQPYGTSSEEARRTAEQLGIEIPTAPQLGPTQEGQPEKLPPVPLLPKVGVPKQFGGGEMFFGPKPSALQTKIAGMTPKERFGSGLGVKPEEETTIIGREKALAEAKREPRDRPSVSELQAEYVDPKTTPERRKVIKQRLVELEGIKALPEKEKAPPTRIQYTDQAIQLLETTKYPKIRDMLGNTIQVNAEQYRKLIAEGANSNEAMRKSAIAGIPSTEVAQTADSLFIADAILKAPNLQTQKSMQQIPQVGFEKAIQDLQANRQAYQVKGVDVEFILNLLRNR